MSAPIPVTIDRSRWLRGEGAARSRLLRSDDSKMCCLGFCALALGATEESLKDRFTPYSLDNKDWIRWDDHLGAGERCRSYPGTISAAMRVNDEEPDETRLTKLLAPWFTLEFVDGPVEP